jgi:hypothetical protein
MGHKRLGSVMVCFCIVLLLFRLGSNGMPYSDGNQSSKVAEIYEMYLM